jgi:beta-lactam-binding protein with PASTA domain
MFAGWRPPRPPAVAAGPAAAPGGRPGRARRAAIVAGGVALTALAGYLVAAVLIFPAPLLPSERRVPRVIAAPEDEARRALREAGFRTELADSAPHAVYAAGVVSWQDPSPGTAAPRGSTVSLTLSEGTPQRVVPDVRDLDPELAQRLLAAAGFAVGRVDTVPGTLAAGVVAGTYPPAGAAVRAGTNLVLQISKGAK